MKNVIFTTITILLAGQMALSQCKELKWPEDKSKAEESVALYGDAMKQGNFRAAANPFRWMLINAPDWHTKLYIDGADIYDNLADKEKDPSTKQVLIDSMLLMYDLRVKYCGDEVNVVNRKAYAAYKYMINNKTKAPELLVFFDRVMEVSGSKIFDSNLVAYMQVVRANKIYNALADDKILERYDNIIAAIDSKVKKAQSENKSQDVEKLKGYKTAIDDLLIGMVKVDCDFVKKNLEPKFKQNPNDITLAKRIFSFMLQGKCTDDPLWLEAGEAIHKVEKDYGLAKNLALRYLSVDNFVKAVPLFKEALELTKTPNEKSEMLIYLGSIEAQNGSKSSAREIFRQAIAVDGGNKEPFEKIGDLYMNSFSDCAKRSNFAEDRLVYIAAYDMYQRAGNSQKMTQAKSQFPSTTEIFEQNWKEGDIKRVECWIGESVKLQTRGKD